MKNIMRHIKLISYALIGLSLIIANALPGYANSPADTKLSNAEIAQKFDQLDKEIANLKNRLNAVINLANASARQLASSKVTDSLQLELKKQSDNLQKTVGNLEIGLKSLNNEINRLQNRMAIAEKRATYADSINFEILSQLVILENRIVSLSNSLSEFNSVSLKDNRTPTNLPASFRERYLNDLALHQNGRHQEAAEQFRRLIAEDRSNELADNAQYWMGECYYSMKQYQRAIIEFEKVRSFPNTDKGDDAQYKLGLCYRQLGNLERARAEFKTLIETYPQSEFVENAKQLMK